MLTHVNFNHVNKVEARYKVLRLNAKLSEVLLLRLRATFHTLPLFFTNVNCRHVRTQRLRGTGNQPSGDRKGRPFLIELVKFFTTLHSPLEMSKKCVKL